MNNTYAKKRNIKGIFLLIYIRIRSFLSGIDVLNDISLLGNQCVMGVSSSTKGHCLLHAIYI